MNIPVNEGWIDRIVRIVIGVVLIVLGFFSVWTGFGRWFAYIVGVILLLTGASGYCLLYVPFNINTKKK